MEYQFKFAIPNLDTTVLVTIVGGIFWILTYYFLVTAVPHSVPGPFITRFTGLWILRVDLSGTRARTVDALHKKYGPVVRLAPNELSFSSIEAIKAIYGSNTTCIKSSAYNNFGRLGMFQMQDPDSHRQRQRRIAHVFSTSSLQQMEPLIQSVVDRVICAIAKRVDKPTDALHWCRMTALDVSGEILMGKSFGAIDGEEKAPAYIHHLDNAYLVWSLFGLSPLFCRILTFVPFEGLQNFLAAGEYVYKYGDDALKEYLKLYGRVSTRRSLLTKLISGDPNAHIGPLSDDEISIEVSNLVFAATDTTGNTMTYALYRLSCYPEWQDRLREEICGLRATGASISFQALQMLPILNGVIMETLRLHPAAPSALPRVTTTTTEISGLCLPSNTLVSMQAYTLQRDQTYFRDPEAFDPNRWITNGTIDFGGPETREMFFAWGKGSRACLGQMMATMELKILIARVIERFSVQVQGASTHADMEMTDHFTLIPKGKKCELIFSETKCAEGAESD